MSVREPGRVFHTVVVGAGMFGSAAAKYLSESGADVLVVVPAGPGPRETVDERSFGAYFDEARITRRVGWDPVWQATDARSLERFRAIEAESGVPFFTECGSLILMAGTVGDRTERMVRQCREDAIAVERLDRDALLAERPELGLPALPGGVVGLLERKQAGYLNPRQLVRAQLALTRAAGGTVLRSAVTGVRRTAGGWRVSVSGPGGRDEVDAGHLLVATGALTNQNPVLPVELALHVFTEPNLLFEVSADQLARFRDLPPVVTIDPEDRGNDNLSLYLVPPTRYPDGRWYIRIGPGMQPVVSELADTADMVDWCAAQRVTAEQRELLTSMARTMLPGLRPESVREACCLIDKTPTRYPYIGRPVDDDALTVAVGGNGHGARGSDEIGRLAARAVLGEAWDFPVPEHVFRPLVRGAEADRDDLSTEFHKPPFGLC